jgi:hypothetical protein
MTSKNAPLVFVGILSVAFAGWEIWQAVGASRPGGLRWGEGGEGNPFSRFTHLVWALVAGTLGFVAVAKGFDHPISLPPISFPIAALLLTIACLYDNFLAKRIRALLSGKFSGKAVNKNEKDQDTKKE